MATNNYIVEQIRSLIKANPEAWDELAFWVLTDARKGVVCQISLDSEAHETLWKIAAHYQQKRIDHIYCQPRSLTDVRSSTKHRQFIKMA